MFGIAKQLNMLFAPVHTGEGINKPDATVSLYSSSLPRLLGLFDSKNGSDENPRPP